MNTYNKRAIEKKWQEYWEREGLFKTSDKPKKKYYNLVMFAYPSGDIHMGHCKNYVIGDVIARYKRRRGFDVLHPFGWDAFGLPAENRAIAEGIHPEKWTMENIRTSDESLKILGISYDWDREIITCLPDYYKWTQWMFLLLYKRGLAYKKEAYVNWCPQCQTVLANEQVIDDRCYRCGTPIEKRKLKQWFFKIAEYAERLLKDLDKLKDWPQRVKVMQRNWIGRSEGCDINFKVVDKNITLRVFTTRPDTIYGVTFMSIAPEHPVLDQLIKNTKNREQVLDYIKSATKRSSLERLEREKDGVFTGCYAINPINGEKVPIFVADYVLIDYGSGVVMGVPAHDERDFQFARKYDLPIKIVIKPKDQDLKVEDMENAYEDYGIMVNSEQFNGLDSSEGIKAVTRYLAEKNSGGPSVNYKLKDWLISRQRYWGAPIPIIYCPKCGTVPVPEEALPVLLPVKIKDFIPKGKSPLASVADFINTRCPKCGSKAERDPDTMDTFVCSSWYFLRYLDPHNDKEFCSMEKAKAWLPIDQYIGGIEHATGHLIYFRFFTKVLYDAGYIPVDEPAQALFTQGMVIRNGEKMSKSKGNVVPVGPFVQKYGADVARITILFAAPPERDMEWTDEGVVGAERFVNRIYRLIAENKDRVSKNPPDSVSDEEEGLYIKLNQTIAKVTEDLESFKFNTAIAALWELLNQLYQTTRKGPAFDYSLYILIQLLSPFAPHLADELWSMVGEKGSLLEYRWPGYDQRYLKEKTITVVLQINGKVRSHIKVPLDTSEEVIRNRALEDAKVQRHLSGKKIRKVIYVPGRILNIVV
ncbi:leucine--tRNA ligase [candidate division WOR-3 bacterium 4484_100]|uniref:Leucine--tRNA ligase n=1 Tax=candidate division WOR-3 bacterium 4484_100 TaxID=1936077 RepID=A0A1V4QE34_UNCW3|nr:MAG: leucine--tRNA ligase [candidate division WOR-3 bacterium 4484_100]